MKIGPWEIILILIIVMMVFGVGKIPQIGKQLGRGIRDFKKYSSVDNAEESDKTATKPSTESISASPKLESPEVTGKASEKLADKVSKD